MGAFFYRMDGVKVWLTFSGEYEQRSAGPAFTSEELARQHSDDVEEVFVWDRPLEKRTMFTVCGIFPSEAARVQPKYDRVNGWAVKRDTYRCDEDHVARCAGERISWWSGKVGPIYIEVNGDDKAKVSARFEDIQQEVMRGRKPELPLTA